MSKTSDGEEIHQRKASGRAANWYRHPSANLTSKPLQITVEVFSKPVTFKVSHQEFVFHNAFMALLVDLEAILETPDKD